jgi:ribose transport system substrate-binding protein
VQKLSLISLIFLLGVSAHAQRKPASSGLETSHTQLRIGVALPSRSVPFYLAVTNGLQQAASEKGYELTVDSADVPPQAHPENTLQLQVQKQIQQIERFIVDGMDCIVLTPVSSQLLGPEIAKANRAGIPVFTMDVRNDSKDGVIARHVSSDNIRGGRLAALELISALQGKGKVVILSVDAASSSQDRVQGFREAISHVPGIQILDVLQTDGRRITAFSLFDTIVKAHPDLNAIFATNDQMALGMFDAIHHGKKSNLVLIGYDASKEVRQKIQARTELYASVIQHPVELGRETIQAISDYFDGNQSGAAKLIEVGVCSQSRLQDCAPAP